MIRENDTALHLAGRLLQQWCVDQYAKIELDRLNFIRANQKTIRADLYSGLRDSIAANDAHEGGKK
jgi:hypothetical protein